MKNKNIMYEVIQSPKNLDAHFKSVTDPGSYISSHWHNSIEILFITSGHLQINIGGKTYNLKENDCIVVNSGIVHSTHCKGGNTSMMLQIPTTLLSKYITDYETSYFDFNTTYNKNLNIIKNILLEMKSLEFSSIEGSNLRFTSLLFELLYQLYNNFRVSIGVAQINKNNLAISGLEPVLQYTKLNYNRSISINEISNIAHLQPEYFCRKFKQYMGQTYIEYLNEVRLSHIYKDLINTDSPLCNLLEIHGFTNIKLFYKVFKNKFNCTPKELRKNKS